MVRILDRQAGFSDSPSLMNGRLSPLPPLSSYQVTQNIPVTARSDITGAGGTANIVSISVPVAFICPISKVVYQNSPLSKLQTQIPRFISLCIWVVPHSQM